LCLVSVGLVLLAAMSYHRGENLDTLLAFLHKAAEFLPRMESGNVGCCRALSRDAHNVSEAVRMETGHRREIRGQRLALAFLELLEQVIDGLLDELLCGVILLHGALLIGRLSLESRILAVRCRVGVAAGVVHNVGSSAVGFVRF
jgi:hypothetical protein